MKYYFKKELKKEALKGRTITYIAKELGYHRCHLYRVFSGNYGCSFKTANSITEYFDSSLTIDHFFIKK